MASPEALKKREGRRWMLKSKITPSFSSFLMLEKQAVKSFPSTAQWNFLQHTVKVHTLDSRKRKAVMNCRTVVAWLDILATSLTRTGHSSLWFGFLLCIFFNLEKGTVGGRTKRVIGSCWDTEWYQQREYRWVIGTGSNTCEAFKLWKYFSASLNSK